MNDINVQLGFNISNYNYDNNTDLLFISGPALEEGVWSDSVGGTFFYPTRIIQEAASEFENSDFVCEHNHLRIGKVTNVALNENGFSINGYFDHKKSIDAVINKRKLGFSIAATVKVNPITRVVEKIYNIQHVALVESPACKICGITSAVTDEGNVIMASRKVKTEEVTESIEVDTSPVEESVELKEDTEVEAPVVETESEDTPTTTVPSVNNVTISTDSIVIEQPLTEVMAALSAATDTVTTVSDQLSSAITRLQDMEVKLSASDTKNIELENKIKEVELKAAEYKSKFEGLQRQLDEQVKTERETIVNEIKSIDPETNMDAIDGMSMVQLSAYKASLDRLSNLGSRKGFKGDESASTEVDTPVEMSAPEESKTLSRTEIARLTIASLQKQRILC